MKHTLNTLEIAEHLVTDIHANWTRIGALALAEYLEELEEDTGEEMELDVVALRCEYSQWLSLQEWAIDYFGGEEAARISLDTNALSEDVIRDYIEENGTLIEFDGGIIVSSF